MFCENPHNFPSLKSSEISWILAKHECNYFFTRVYYLITLWVKNYKPIRQFFRLNFAMAILQFHM